jgi:inosine/xanthosine triphosphatase
MRTSIVIGSLNPTKTNGAMRAIHQRPDLPWVDALVVNSSASSGVSNQPSSLEEMVTGARNRMLWLFRNVDGNTADTLFITMESGLFHLEGARRLDACVAIVQTDTGGCLGMSSAFTIPSEVDNWLDSDRVARGLTLDDACRVGITRKDRIGQTVGLSGLQSGGLYTREDSAFEAVRNALFGLYPRVGG